MILLAALALGLFAGGVLVGWGIGAVATEREENRMWAAETARWRKNLETQPRWNVTGEALDAYERSEG